MEQEVYLEEDHDTENILRINVRQCQTIHSLGGIVSVPYHI